MRFFKPKHIQAVQGRYLTRTSTQSTLDASAALPNSGYDFIDNSQGASAAVAELSRALDDSINDIVLEGTKTSLQDHK
jgi:hypothetical protein